MKWVCEPEKGERERRVAASQLDLMLSHYLWQEAGRQDRAGQRPGRLDRKKEAPLARPRNLDLADRTHIRSIGAIGDLFRRCCYLPTVHSNLRHPFIPVSNSPAGQPLNVNAAGEYQRCWRAPISGYLPTGRPVARACVRR